MLDLASHLKYLQSILLEYNADGSLKELTMIRYFLENLKLSIRAEIE